MSLAVTIRIVLLLGVLAAPARAQDAPSAAPAAAAAAAAIPAPRADHHQHLVSPPGAAWLDRTLPPIVLPEDLADLLRRRTALAPDEAAVAGLYTEDAVMMGGSFRDWLQGPASIADYVNFRGAAYTLTPVLLRRHGDLAQIHGYYTSRPEGTHFSFFTLSARRGADGAWKIAGETFASPGPRPKQALIDAEQLVAMLDDAGMKRAVVLSTAFWFDSPTRPRPGDFYARVRAENDWTAQQAARFPQRLLAFCSFNPLEDYAIAEMTRCMRAGSKGVKLHFGSSGVNLQNPEHLARLRRVFQAADRLNAPIAVHTRTYEGPYGPEEARTIVRELFAAAPRITITVAHLWGGEAYSQPVLDEFTAAVRENRPGTRNLYFDISDVADVAQGNAERLNTIAQRLREIGLQRILYGSDAVGQGHPAPKEAWERTKRGLPLTPAEFGVIAGNAPPYLR